MKLIYEHIPKCICSYETILRGLVEPDCPRCNYDELKIAKEIEKLCLENLVNKPEHKEIILYETNI